MSMLLLGVGGVGAAPESPLLTDLISYWKMDEASGARSDSHGTNDLADNGGVTSAAGKINNAASLAAASSQYLSCANNASLQTGDIDFTLSFWVYLDSKDTDGIIATRNAGKAGGEYNLTYSLNDDAFYFDVLTGTGAVSAVPVALSTWYNVIAWRDATAGTVNIQVNGETPVSVVSAPSSAVAAALTIGAISGGSSCLDGRIDEGAFWKRVLTSDERALVYGAGTPPDYPYS